MKSETAIPIADALAAVVDAFRAGDFAQAEAQADAALSSDFESPLVQAALKCAVFWKDRESRSEALATPEERSDYLLRELEGFQKRFLPHLDDPFAEGVAALRGEVYRRAAQGYLDQVRFEDEGRRPELWLKAARAWKAHGALDRAQEALEGAWKARPDDAGVLAEMADCFEAVGDEARGRLFFREAFYLDPQAIDVEALVSVSLGRLVRDLKAEGLSGALLREWLPVRAVTEGVFNIKRELKTLEVGQLKQTINTLKAELHDGRSVRAEVLPRLLYRYFWLIDHYHSNQDDRGKVDDILLTIRLLDERTYERYTR